MLPRSSLFRAGGGLLLALTAGVAIIAGSAFAAYQTEAPSLSPTPTAPLVRDWQADSQVTQANVTNLLSGPALAVSNRGFATGADDADIDAETTVTSESPRASAAPSRSPTPRLRDEIILDDRVLNPPSEFPAVPYPNPTTTPPDGIAPPDTAPQTPTPTLDPDNPYREQTP